VSYEIYRLLHFAGLFLIFLAIGALVHRAQSGAQGEGGVKVAKACHGAGLLLVLVGGFGMLARLGLSLGAAPWVWIKLGVWAVLGGIVVLPRRRPGLAWLLWILVPFLGLVAVWAVMVKPGA